MPSIQKPYTDADVQAAEDAVAAVYDDGQPHEHEDEIRAALDAVAPAIAARALREAAAGYRAVEGNRHISPPDMWLNRRADKIEHGAK